MSDEVLLVYDDAVLAHRPERLMPAEPEPPPEVQSGEGDDGAVQGGASWVHPERPERVSALLESLVATPIAGCDWAPSEPADRAALERVHRPYYLDYVEALRGRTEMIDPDTTAVSAGTVDAAAAAAGAAVAACEAVHAGRARSAFALIRPPGHHAMPARAMGFCFYNNAAVAAAHLRACHGYERILLLDWDLHHGNGTQEIFYADPGVLFVDPHCAAPFYPGTGALEEIGRDGGVGTTVNVPLPLGCGNHDLAAVCESIVAPLADMFQPQFVVVSSGFDLHRADQAMAVDEAGFAAMAAAVRDIADRHAGGRLALVMEGGYTLDAIVPSARACLEVLAGGEAPAADPATGTEAGAAAVAEARWFHGV